MSSRQKKGEKTRGQHASESESNVYNEKTDCPVPYISCVCKEVPLPQSVDDDEPGVKMRCTNDRCHLVRLLLHEKCFLQLEDVLLKILSNLGSARGWTNAQLRCNLWEKKGLTLISKLIRCHCGQGLMSRDVDFYKKHELEIVKDPQQQMDVKQRKKKNPKKLPTLNFNSNLPVAAELLQNDFVGINRRSSHGHTSFSSSTLCNNWNELSDSESENVHDRLRTFTPTPTTKAKLIAERPKPSSADRPPISQQPKPRASRTRTSRAMSRQQQRKEKESKLAKESAVRPKNAPILTFHAKMEAAAKNAERMAASKDGGSSSVAETKQQSVSAVKVKTLDEESERDVERFYTLFNSNCSFLLGELLMADAHLPRLLPPHSF